VNKSFKISRFKKSIVWSLLLLTGWIAIDIFYPLKKSITSIDAEKTARLEAAMWRSYYEKRPVRLFFQSAKLMREEFHFPWWRSHFVAYYTARAAFVFKDGHNSSDYQKALPYLKKYYGLINEISTTSFSPDSAAASELEWWIIRRNREKHPPQEWENLLTLTASIIYHLPADSFREYAMLRVKAMLLRDEKGSSITEEDWRKINGILADAWRSFANTLAQKPEF
jgi:hypothetical protein